MVDRRTIAASLLLLAGCSSEGQPMLLGYVCKQVSVAGTETPACTVSGDAEITSGITPDSTAVRLGPDSGVVRIRLNAIPAVSANSWSLDALAAANPLRGEGNTLFRRVEWGSCDTTCPNNPQDSQAAMSEDFAWASMVDDTPGTNGNFAPDDAVLELRGADIDIVDIRTPGFDGTGFVAQ